MSGWRIEITVEFEEWLLTCPENVQESVAAMFPLLREQGPTLSRPFADSLKGSKHSNMKELRPTRTVRVLFAFDPDRKAILLIGGDKAGRPGQKFYKQLIKKADKLFDKHLKETEAKDG